MRESHLTKKILHVMVKLTIWDGTRFVFHRNDNSPGSLVRTGYFCVDSSNTAPYGVSCDGITSLSADKYSEIFFSPLHRCSPLHPFPGRIPPLYHRSRRSIYSPTHRPTRLIHPLILVEQPDFHPFPRNSTTSLKHTVKTALLSATQESSSLDSDSLPTTHSPPVQHLPSSNTLHSLTEPMFVCPFSITRLKCPFHRIIISFLYLVRLTYFSKDEREFINILEILPFVNYFFNPLSLCKIEIF